ncbi:MAG: hypothetical protein J0I40_13155 [Cellulomonas sp.]|uniref:hypothetical protein n=1 Tax=Cellulomonas sp. 73-92 TaxID=1895740 RepID=UPI000AD6E9F2|nr:hypothetical protein [Cellulomonas sp. 73-92]MBN9376309.1 hypothetical protein [Cellulomonas sp.]
MNHPQNRPRTHLERSIIAVVRTRTLTLAVVLAAALAGCSGSQTPASAPSSGAAADPTSSAASSPQRASSGPTQIPTSAAPTTPAAPSDPLAAAAVRIGCTGWAVGSDMAPGVDEWGTCTFNGTKAQLYLITSDANYKTFVTAVGSYGITEAHIVRAGNVVGVANDGTQEAAFKAALAG